MKLYDARENEIIIRPLPTPKPSDGMLGGRETKWERNIMYIVAGFLLLISALSVAIAIWG